MPLATRRFYIRYTRRSIHQLPIKQKVIKAEQRDSNWLRAVIGGCLRRVLVLSLEAILKFVPMSSIDGAFENFGTRDPALQPLILERDAEHSFILLRTEVHQPARYFPHLLKFQNV